MRSDLVAMKIWIWVTWKIRAAYEIETTGLAKRKSEGIDNQADCLSHDSWSPSSEVTQWAAPFAHFVFVADPHWLLWATAQRAGGAVCSLLHSNLGTFGAKIENLLINCNCLLLPLGSKSIYRAAPMLIIPYNPFTVETKHRHLRYLLNISDLNHIMFKMEIIWFIMIML